MEFQLSAGALKELAEVLRENGTWQAPTLAMNGRMVLVDALLAGDVLRYLPPEERRAWSAVAAEANTRRIEAVVLDGRLLDREELDRILEGVETHAAGSPPLASSIR